MLEINGNNTQFFSQTSETFLRQLFYEDIIQLLIGGDKLNYYVIFTQLLCYF